MRITNETRLQTKAEQFLDYKDGGFKQFHRILANGKETGVHQIISGHKYNKYPNKVIYMANDKKFSNVKDAMEEAGHAYLRED